MASPSAPLRLRADELLREPGVRRTLRGSFAPADLDAEHDAVVGDVEVDLVVESVRGVASTVVTVDVEVTGTVTVSWSGSCRRCLATLSGVAVVAVDERYQAIVTDPDAFPIEDRMLDLAPLVRAAVLLEAAEERLCRAACAGLCPVCGIDRNVESCDCVLTEPDERWRVLDELRLDP
jgi:uncharacterized protein